MHVLADSVPGMCWCLVNRGVMPSWTPFTLDAQKLKQMMQWEFIILTSLPIGGSADDQRRDQEEYGEAGLQWCCEWVQGT